jgi:hypothetical protein
MSSYYSIDNNPELPENADKGLDPMNCALHSQKITGELSYIMNNDGEYPADAPPCYCSLGINEALRMSSPYELESVDEEEDRLLPLGGHLLPEDFQNLIREHNILIEKITGKFWSDDGALQKFKEVFPLDYNTFRVECLRLTKLYPKEVKAVKDYQKANA